MPAASPSGASPTIAPVIGDPASAATIDIVATSGRHRGDIGKQTILRSRHAAAAQLGQSHAGEIAALFESAKGNQDAHPSGRRRMSALPDVNIPDCQLQRPELLTGKADRDHGLGLL
jgi:hypothetical protein